ncbi:hypothetical protein [Tepidibacter formicigenes]|jgi:post-segregation antitoxin (ccd killing protein)|uniref:Uncharacterized protein n=1 Tax=Tepidibacter formicigenes DSM 15518 TaxID=1123349 RepID=A0A1M6SAY0_9FIRM|nr:hypothetical protein [Tepidibacter formicigenes]SHK41933.1 hypothetical protein SAMN02744037_02303 [Tepidibacter formicigenes DSM 15518]
MTRKSINTTLDTELYSKIKILALKVSAEKQTKVNANDLIEEGMKLIIERYESEKNKS